MLAFFQMHEKGTICIMLSSFSYLAITYELILITENLTAEESYHMQKFTIREELIALHIFLRKHAKI